MEYGKDICVGKFLPNGAWKDAPRPWASVMPKLQHFQYADDKKDAAMFLEDYHVRVKDKVISALAGWDYDGGSVSRVFWTSIGHPFMVGKMIQYYLHDACYCMNLLKQKAADDLLLESLAVFGGTPWLTRNEIWLAVRGFGGFVYPKTKKELDLYKDYVFISDLGGHGCADERLTGVGPRKSIRPEVTLD